MSAILVRGFSSTAIYISRVRPGSLEEERGELSKQPDCICIYTPHKKPAVEPHVALPSIKAGLHRLTGRVALPELLRETAVLDSGGGAAARWYLPRVFFWMELFWGSD